MYKRRGWWGLLPSSEATALVFHLEMSVLNASAELNAVHEAEERESERKRKKSEKNQFF